MTRYIDAEELYDEIKFLSVFLGGDNAFNKVAKESVLDMVDKQPAADVVEVKQIEIIRDDLKWWLKTNSEKGVVYIPKYVVENMIAKMDGQRK